MCRSTTQRKMHTNVFIGSAYFEFSFLFTFIFIYCFGGTLHAKHGFMPNSLMYLSPCIIVSSPSNCSLHLHISVSFPLLVVDVKLFLPFNFSSPSELCHSRILKLFTCVGNHPIRYIRDYFSVRIGIWQFAEIGEEEGLKDY
jgi:hypothetical protein